MSEGKQLIVSIGREFGSGGHEIAEHIAKDLSLPLYDYNLMRVIAEEKELSDTKTLERYDELPRFPISISVRGYSTSPEQNLAILQFNYLQEKAANGESFVIVGRCAETVLKDYKCLIPIFILADHDKKVERIMNIYQMDKKEAERTVKEQNKKRRAYHNYYSTAKWGDSRLYNLSVNSSKLGIEKTKELIEDFIIKRRELL